MKEPLRNQAIEALQAQHNAIDYLMARVIALDHSFLPSKSGLPWAAMLQGLDAMQALTQETRNEFDPAR